MLMYPPTCGFLTDSQIGTITWNLGGEARLIRLSAGRARASSSFVGSGWHVRACGLVPRRGYLHECIGVGPAAPDRLSQFCQIKMIRTTQYFGAHDHPKPAVSGEKEKQLWGCYHGAGRLESSRASETHRKRSWMSLPRQGSMVFVVVLHVRSERARGAAPFAADDNSSFSPCILISP